MFQRFCMPLGAILFSCTLVFANDPTLLIKTPTGIPVDTKWKEQVYNFAMKNVVHPAWGLAHSERDYQVALLLAKREGFSIDSDVLFAAAFLHDVGGIGSFQKKGVDHAVRSVEIAEPRLMSWGFPSNKWPQVKEMILGHTYYGTKPTTKAALAFRDADIVDFLGNIGIARLLGATMDPDFFDGTLKPAVITLKEFSQTMAEKCSLTACHELAKPRQAELESFLSILNNETFQEKAL
ncbi:MAG: HD domain-containing protein [Bdellovibrionaceae bacterium]|nr:HD domain-containing protein [Pseudobdellovibrionaceae bacterium]